MRRLVFGARGSSPLARGLRDREILPVGASKDHPRSRGVYVAVLNDGSGVLGSSPLARGLLPCCGEVQGGNGIIPARAGFTGRLVR